MLLTCPASWLSSPSCWRGIYSTDPCCTGTHTWNCRGYLLFQIPWILFRNHSPYNHQFLHPNTHHSHDRIQNCRLHWQPTNRIQRMKTTWHFAAMKKLYSLSVAVLHSFWVLPHSPTEIWTRLDQLLLGILAVEGSEDFRIHSLKEILPKGWRKVWEWLGIPGCPMPSYVPGLVRSLKWWLWHPKWCLCCFFDFAVK